MHVTLLMLDYVVVHHRTLTKIAKLYVYASKVLALSSCIPSRTVLDGAEHTVSGPGP
jgi:hypothetical protein